MTNREFTLTWLQEQGYPYNKLPVGTPESVEKCVVTRALNRLDKYAGHTVIAYKTYAWITAGRTRRELGFPFEVRRFIEEFDAREHSDLIARYS